jgi:5-formyltetrahydrofolate cyclo-ligase
MGPSASPPDDLRAWRKVERARLVEARMALPLDQHKAASDAISRLLMARFPPDSLPSLGCYWPFRREYDCIPLMRRVLDAGGKVALPVVIEKNHPLEFRPWTPTAKMEAGVWNILHPAEGPAVHPQALLVPLVGFDAAGYRLGYGAGYYDRTLAAFPKTPVTIGVGFELCRMQTIFPQPHDVPMDFIITEAGLVHTRAAGH